MPLRGCNSHSSLQETSMLLCTPHVSSYIVEFEYFVILSSYFSFTDLGNVNALSNWVSTSNCSFIFWNTLGTLVSDVIFDVIWTVRSPVCLYIVSSGTVFMYRKRFHNWTRESCILLDLMKKYYNLHWYKPLVPKFTNILAKWFQKMAVNTAKWLNHRK